MLLVRINELMSRLLLPVCCLLIRFLNAPPQQEALLLSVDLCHCSVFAAMTGQSASLVLPVKPETDTDGGMQAGREGGRGEGGGLYLTGRREGVPSWERSASPYQTPAIPPRVGGASRTLCAASISADSRIDNGTAQPGRWMFCFLWFFFSLRLSSAEHQPRLTVSIAPVSAAAPPAGDADTAAGAALRPAGDAP